MIQLMCNITDWENPAPEICPVCEGLLRDHWRERPCLSPTMNPNDKVKYPHTLHFPWSPGLQNDDRVITDNQMAGKTVIISEKMDGENTTMYCDAIHARSREAMASHPSRGYVKALHGSIAHLIPPGFRVCGENLFAKHSIHYKGMNALASYFQVFSIWDKDNNCLRWDETRIICNTLGLKTVPVKFIGVYSEEFLKRFYLPWMIDSVEGYVVRVAECFPQSKFENYVAKYVRKGHVQTSEHWLNEPMVRNELACEFDDCVDDECTNT